MNTNRNERGQTLVLIAIALVALLGFAALAIDGGRVYSEQRRAQSAADTAAYAAGLADMEGDDPYQAALAQAELNAYADSDPGANPDEPVDVMVNHPPSRGVYAGDNEYYEVMVRTAVEGTFSRILGLNTIAVEGYAVVHARDISSASGENAIHGLKNSDEAIEVLGNITLTVRGGHIFSNADINKSGTSGSVEAVGGSIYAAGGWKGATNVWPAPVTGVPPQYATSVVAPTCPDEAGTFSGSLMTPGVFAKEVKIETGDITMAPGIYCLEAGMQVNGNASLTGHGILIVLLGGEIRLNGTGDVIWTRASDIKDSAGHQYGGMLLYVPPSNPNPVYLTGGNGTRFAGTILAPASNCEFGGESDAVSIRANIVCDTITFNGNPHIDIAYNPRQNFQLASFIELSQ